MRFAVLIHSVFLMVVIAAIEHAYAGGYETVRENIARAQNLAQRYLQAADRIDGGLRAGQVFRHADKREHYCSILADLLQVPETVPEEYMLEDPGLLSNEPYQLRLYAQSLRNYVDLANSLNRQSDFSLRYLWNLNCWSRFELRKHFTDDRYHDYVVSTTPDRKTLRIVGDIRSGLFGVVARRLTVHRSIQNVELGSFGGNVYEAIKIGELIRQKGLNTVLSNNCFSACTLMFLGGVERRIPAPYYSLGFHRVTSRGLPLPAFDDVYTTIKDYADEMAAVGDDVVRANLAGDGINYFMYSRQELCERNIATWVESVCAFHGPQSGSYKKKVRSSSIEALR
jgi:hypothetical protein